MVPARTPLPEEAMPEVRSDCVCERVAHQVGRLDSESSPVLVALDLRSLRYIGNQELGAIVTLNRKVREAGGRLSLINVQPAVADVFAVTGLDTLIQVRPGG